MADVPYPNIEQLARITIGDLFPSGSTGLVTPGDLEDRLPFGRVRRVGGADTDPFTDAARVAVDVFSLTYAEGAPLAEDVRQRLRTAPDPFDRVFTVTAPIEVPWADGSAVRRWTATYGITLRRT